jgi:hypothetical protein
MAGALFGVRGRRREGVSAARDSGMVRWIWEQKHK